MTATDLDIRLKWLATGDRKQAAWSTSKVGFGVGVKRSRNRAQPTGKGAELGGGAFARTDETGEWGRLDFVASDAMVGEYDAKKRETWLKDTEDDRTPGVLPWYETGEQKNIRQALPLEGAVLRSAAVGEGFEREHVLFLNRAHLISHHRPEDPPINSTPISDPGKGKGDWTAGLHSLTRVRPWVHGWCAAAPDPNETITEEDEPEPELYSALLNFTKSEGDYTGWGGVHHAEGEGVMSAEGWGFSRYGAPKHWLASTSEAEIRRESFDIDRGIFGDGTDPWSAPMHFQRKIWRRGVKAPYITNPELRYRPNMLHAHPCGPRPGMWDWIDYADFRTYRPPGYPPETPREPPPRYPEEDPPNWVPTFPPPHIGPNPRPSTTTPNEVEAPSMHGHPIPDGPDRPASGISSGAPDGISGTEPVGPAEEVDRFWLEMYGWVERKFLEQPITSHGIAGAVYENSTAAEGKQDRWRPVKSQLEEIEVDDDGLVLGRTAALGPGHFTFAGSDVQLSDLYTGVNTPERVFNDFSLGVFAAGNAGGSWADGRLGVGSRLPGSAFFRSGFDISLDFNGASDPAEPDVYMTSRDASGALGAADLYWNNNRVLTTADGTGSGNVTTSDTLTAGNVIIGNGTVDVEDSGIAADDLITAPLAIDDNAVLVGSGGGHVVEQAPVFIDPANGNATGFGTIASGAIDSTSHIKSSSATAGIGYATGAGGTVTQSTSKSTGVTINKVCGQITTHSAALAAGASVTFTVNNSAVAATDNFAHPVVAKGGAGDPAAYRVSISNAQAGSFDMTIDNVSTSSLSEAIEINFAIIKGVTS